MNRECGCLPAAVTQCGRDHALAGRFRPLRRLIGQYQHRRETMRTARIRSDASHARTRKTYLRPEPVVRYPRPAIDRGRRACRPGKRLHARRRSALARTTKQRSRLRRAAPRAARQGMRKRSRITVRSYRCPSPRTARPIVCRYRTHRVQSALARVER